MLPQPPPLQYRIIVSSQSSIHPRTYTVTLTSHRHGADINFKEPPSTDQTAVPSRSVVMTACQKSIAENVQALL